MGIFNRSYKLRSRCGGLVSAGEIIQELADRAADRPSFYRPKRQISPAADTIKKRAGIREVQLELFHAEQPCVTDTPELTGLPRIAKCPSHSADRPLEDLIPEAYENA